MTGIIYIADFIKNPDELFTALSDVIHWDERMTARKTASFGVAYNYGQMGYPYKDFLPELSAISNQLIPAIGFEPNNCLINYYQNGSSKMGYHSDQTDILETGTGIAIVSLGATRMLTFRNIENPVETFGYDLPAGSLIYMTQEIQYSWQHAIPKSNTQQPRISLTFRRMR